MGPGMSSQPEAVGDLAGFGPPDGVIALPYAFDYPALAHVVRER